MVEHMYLSSIEEIIYPPSNNRYNNYHHY